MSGHLFLTMPAASYCLLSGILIAAAGPQASSIDATSADESVSAQSADDGTTLPDAASSETGTPEDLSRWEYSTEIDLPAADNASQTDGPGKDLIDFFLVSDVFAHATPDLADLRIHSASGLAIPYALRILEPRSVRDVVPAIEFNRNEPENDVHELTLDLQRDDIDHNEVTIDTTGASFRRPVVIEGSNDAKDWKPLASGNIVRFPAEKEPFQIQSFSYSNSRHRYVRIQINPDPLAGDIVNGIDNFSITSAEVIQHLELPGESVTMNTVLGTREPTRQFGVPASRWIVNLEGDNIPCNRFEVDVKDAEFARDVSLESEYVNSQGQSLFGSMGVYGTWQRLRGDAVEPMFLEFSEARAKRLRITVADYRNKPLSLTAVRVTSPARQIIFERPPQSELPLRLYLGNPEAEPANYDFARNLPEKLTAKPVRATLKAAEINPEFIPTPKAFTERFPWLVYVTLSAVSIVLGTVVVGLSRTAILNHDSSIAEQSEKLIA